MTVLVDTSVLIDVLRSRQPSRAVLSSALARGPVHASQLTRFEVLAGVRPGEEEATEGLLSLLTWHAVDEAIVTKAAEFSRTWRSSHQGIGPVAFLVAATTWQVSARLLTTNVKHFPMFPGLTAPY